MPNDLDSLRSELQSWSDWLNSTPTQQVLSHLRGLAATNQEVARQSSVGLSKTFDCTVQDALVVKAELLAETSGFLALDHFVSKRQDELVTSINQLTQSSNGTDTDRPFRGTGSTDDTDQRNTVI